MPNTASVPSVLSILVCDSVIIDAITHKKTLVGLFETINTLQVPIAQSLGFYSRITDMDGKYEFAIRVAFLGPEGEEMIGSLTTPEVKSEGPLAIIDIALNLPPVTFPKFGRYELQLFGNDFYLGRATVEVNKIQENQ